MTLAGKRILVTGGTGHLGSNLVAGLIARGARPCDITVFVPAGTPRDALADIEGITFTDGDITEATSVKAACHDAERVFHVAGNTSFDPFRRRVQWLVNVEGTRNVLDACAASPSVEKLVHTSTVNTLGVPGQRGSLGNEDTSPYDPTTRTVHSFGSPGEILAFADAVHDGSAPVKWWNRIDIGYFDSKLAAQELVTRAHAENGLPAISVLPGSFYGPRDFFVGNGIYILYVYNGKLPGYLNAGFPLGHVSDIVIGHVLAMERGEPGGRYIISGHAADNRYMNDMLAIIANVIESETGAPVKRGWRQVRPCVAMLAARLSEFWAGLTHTPCLLSTAAVRSGSFPSFYDCTRAREKLGYEPSCTFADAVRDHFRYFALHDLLGRKGRSV